MIKFGFRHNLIFPLMLISFNFIRKIDLLVLDKIFDFSFSMLLTFLMFSGEFFAGLILYKYQTSFLPKKNQNTFMGIKLIQSSSDLSPRDSRFKMNLLIFMASFFDFIEFLLSTFYIPQYKDKSKSLEIRLSSILTISSALFFYFVLKLPLFKHQIFSLLVIVICLVLICFFEYLYEILYVKKTLNIIVFVLIIFVHIFNSLLDSIEKYLVEYNYLNPFKTLMMEGMFGLILSFCYSFVKNPFIEIINFNGSNIKFSVLIILLFLYFLLSGGRNAYRVATNKIYSPMTKSLTDYILNPFLLTYYYVLDNDFEDSEHQNQNIFYFIINLIISIVIVFFGCVFNEIFILFCCNLEYNTHNQVSMRASTVDIDEEENEDNLSDNDDDEEKINQNKNDT